MPGLGLEVDLAVVWQVETCSQQDPSGPPFCNPAPLVTVQCMERLGSETSPAWAHSVQDMVGGASNLSEPHVYFPCKNRDKRYLLGRVDARKLSQRGWSWDFLSGLSGGFCHYTQSPGPQRVRRGMEVIGCQKILLDLSSKLC